jgi:hypothetical protein
MGNAEAKMSGLPADQAYVNLISSTWNFLNDNP